MSACAVVSSLTEDTRILVGGYTYATHFAVAMLGGLGLVFALGALLGMDDNTSSSIRAFANFGLFRLVAVAVILIADWQELKICERFTLHGSEFSSVTGNYYNAAIETVALGNRCQHTRSWHLALSFADIIVSLYGVSLCRRWVYMLTSAPVYHISPDETRPLRLFQGYANVGAPPADYGRGRDGTSPYAGQPL